MVCRGKHFKNKKGPRDKSRGPFELYGRDGVIRTLDPLHPMQVRYQAALRPDELRIISEHLAFLGHKIARAALPAAALRCVKLRHMPGVANPQPKRQFASVQNYNPLRIQVLFLKQCCN